MSRWSDGLPTVKVAQGQVPKAITFVYPYYQNAGFLEQQVAFWRAYPEDLRRQLSIIIVDDGSPTPAALPADRPCPMRLFRIEIDVRWNWLAARNIGMHHAPEGWCLMTDMDHVVPEVTLRAMVYGGFDPRLAYAFLRLEHTGQAAQPHSASLFLTRATFWRTGGYDEALSGYYGTDGEFRRRLMKTTSSFFILAQPLIRHEFVGDSSTSRYLRKQPEDLAVQRLIAQRPAHWRPKTLSFPYHEVAA